MLAQQTLHDLENILLDYFAPAPALNLHRSLPGPHPHVRPHAQKCIASDLLAPLHRFEQKRVRLVGGNGKKRGNRRQQIGAHRFHHRDQRGLAGQPRKLFKVGLQHLDIRTAMPR